MRIGYAFAALCIAACPSMAGSAAAQAASPLGAFTCYGTQSRGPTDRRDVTLVDEFGTYQAETRKINELCAPTDVNGNDPTAPSDPAHLAAYRLRTKGRFATAERQVVVNQFGTTTLDVSGKPNTLLVPTAKSLTGPPSPLGAFVDHFTCHRAKTSRGTPRFAGVDDVAIATQFETVVIDVRKPRSLCVPTNKNGEDPGAENGVERLLCYRIRGKGNPGRIDLFLNNQFGQQTARLGRRKELCVPTLESPSSTTTTSSSTTTTLVPVTTTSTTTSSSSSTVVTTTSTTTTTLYGSPSRAFVVPVPNLID
jgi:hypothetical protein